MGAQKKLHQEEISEVKKALENLKTELSQQSAGQFVLYLSILLFFVISD